MRPSALATGALVPGMGALTARPTPGRGRGFSQGTWPRVPRSLRAEGRDKASGGGAWTPATVDAQSRGQGMRRLTYLHVRHRLPVCLAFFEFPER